MNHVYDRDYSTTLLHSGGIRVTGRTARMWMFQFPFRPKATVTVSYAIRGSIIMTDMTDMTDRTHTKVQTIGLASGCAPSLYGTCTVSVDKIERASDHHSLAAPSTIEPCLSHDRVSEPCFDPTSFASSPTYPSPDPTLKPTDAAVAGRTPRSELRLGRLDRREQHVPDVSSCLVEVEAHPFAAESLADDIELDAVPMVSDARNG